jgi:hypothetical protein
MKFVVRDTYSSMAASTTIRMGMTLIRPQRGCGVGLYTAGASEPTTDVGA